MERATFDVLSALVLLLTALVGAYLPKHLHARGGGAGGSPTAALAFHLGNMLSAGVMLSAGFCHLLADSLRQLSFIGHFPIATFLAASGYLVTLMADQAVQALMDREERRSGGGGGCGPGGISGGGAYHAVGVSSPRSSSGVRHGSGGGGGGGSSGGAHHHHHHHPRVAAVAARACCSGGGGGSGDSDGSFGSFNGDGANGGMQEVALVAMPAVGSDGFAAAAAATNGPLSPTHRHARAAQQQQQPLHEPAANGHSAACLSPHAHRPLHEKQHPHQQQHLGKQLSPLHPHYRGGGGPFGRAGDDDLALTVAAAAAAPGSPRGLAAADAAHAAAGASHNHFQALLSARRLSFATALLLAGALCIHSLLEGMALGAQPALRGAEDIFLAIVAHKGLAAYALGASIVESRASDAKFWSTACLFAFATPVGIGLGYASAAHGGAIGAAVSALAAGTFVYVALMEVVPKELEDGQHRGAKMAAMLLGFGLMSLLAVWA